jgi:hypothetical protein
VLRRIFGPRRGEVTGDWRKINSEKLRNFYSSPNIIRMVKSTGIKLHVQRMGKNINPYKFSIGKIPLGADIKMCLKE